MSQNMSKYVAPVMLSYEDFPESTASSEGMRSLPKSSYDRIRLDILTYDEENDLKILYISHEPEEEKASETGKVPEAEKASNKGTGAEAEGRLPLLFYVQGSAWMKQELHAHLFELSGIAKKGFNVAIAQYRSTDVGPFPLQVEDSKRALKYLVDRSAEYRIDPANLFLWGDSSGGHTVMMMAVTHNRYFQDFELPALRGVIDFYGPTHIATMNDAASTQDHLGPESPEGRLIGRLNVAEHPERADQTIIMNYIDENVPLVPVLMLHGNKDRLVPFEQSIELFECLKAKGKDVTFYRLEQADHGGRYFWHEKTLSIVEEFIRTHLA